jgi:hypothetical protein
MQPENLLAKEAITRYIDEMNQSLKYNYILFVKRREKDISYIYRLMQKMK